MEARKFEPEQRGTKSFEKTVSATDLPFTWQRLANFVHPLVWAWIAALWLGLAWLILSEIG